MFHIFHLFQSVMVSGILNPFSGIFNAIPSEKSVPKSAFLVNLRVTSGQHSLSRLLNADWLIQILRVTGRTQGIFSHTNSIRIRRSLSVDSL